MSESLSCDFWFHLIHELKPPLWVKTKSERLICLKIAKTARGGSGLKRSILNLGPGTYCSTIFGMWSGHLFPFPRSQIGGGGGEMTWIHW